MGNIDNKRQLSAEEIKSVINNRAKRKGIEVKDIEIENNITLNGTIGGKVNSDFSAEIGIVGVEANKVIVELCEFKVKKLGFLKGTTNIFIKGLLNAFGKDKIIMKGNNIVFDIEEIKKDAPRFEVDVDNVYIREKLLNIEGKKLKTMFKI